MSRNKNADFTKYVHEYVDANGKTRYVPCEFLEADGRYFCPMDRTERKRTGCTGYFAKKPQGISNGYASKTKALRRARYLFGAMTQGG